jgi:hypothetical protein
LKEFALYAQLRVDGKAKTKNSTADLQSGNLHKRYLIPARAKAEPRRFGWHDFRRTHATLLSDKSGRLFAWGVC